MWRIILAAAVIWNVFLGEVKAVVITFSDQLAGEGPMNPALYNSTEGLPAGLAASFNGFTRYDGSAGELDHTPSGANRFLYGDSDDPQISFNEPVTIPSFWMAIGSTGGTPGESVEGTLGGQIAFSFTYSGPPANWFEVTSGASHIVDKVQFHGFQDSWLDDVTVTAAPEPGSLGLLGMATIVVGRVCRRPK